MWDTTSECGTPLNIGHFRCSQGVPYSLYTKAGQLKVLTKSITVGVGLFVLEPSRITVCYVIHCVCVYWRAELGYGRKLSKKLNCR